MKRMLINATQREELRIALVDGQRLYDLDIESVGHEQKKANIYKGTITKINPSLEAAFVAYGGERDGFLPLKEIAESYFPSDVSGRRIIKNLKEGQEVLVQIEKEIRGKKGAALTTYISLAGSYLVLMPNDPRAGGVSRRIEGEERADLKRNIDALEKPKGMGVIARTAGVGKNQEELQQDLDALVVYWKAIQTEAKNHPAPRLIHKESDVITRAFRDYLREDIGEIFIDNPKTLEIAKKRLEDLGRVEYINRLKLYDGEISLFSHYQIEGQIESAFQREVRLHSGGSIVIDTTEALTTIDINSAKSIKGSDIEETAYSTNLEAAVEIARQLRLRDVGGLIVIDFIDMTPIRHQREVENCLKEALKTDRARIQTARISRFGLLEMSRQRLSPSLREATHHVCPRCQGTGTVRDNNSLSLSILRLIQEEAMKENTSQIDVIVPVPIASYLLNEKRHAITSIEQSYPNIKVVIAADMEMETPLYKVLRKRRGEENDVLSYNLPKHLRDLEDDEEELQDIEVAEEVAVLSGVKVEINPTINKAKPEVKDEPSVGFFASIATAIKGLFSSNKVEEVTDKPVVDKQTKPSNDRGNRRNNSRRKLPAKNNAQTATSSQNAQTTNAVETKENKEPAKNNRRTRGNKNEQLATQTTEVKEVKAAKDVKDNVAPVKSEPKPRRERRNLSKKVRVQAPVVTDKEVATSPTPVSNSTQVANEIVPIISQTLQPVILSEQVSNDNSETVASNRRPRRTSRHLRLNGQRRRKPSKNNGLAKSPMPLLSAVYSPEFALGKVTVDYSLINNATVNDNDSVVTEPAQKTKRAAKAEKMVIPTLLLPVVSPLVDSVAFQIEAELVIEPEQETVSEVLETNTEINSEPQLQEEVVTVVSDKTEQVTVETDSGTVVIKQSYTAYSMMTKAPAIDSEELVSDVVINCRDDSNYQYNGKGNAGAMSASNQSGSGISKPTSLSNDL